MSPPIPPISLQTLHIAGHLIDIHGLDELPPSATHITILWLCHGRLGCKEDMADTAARSVRAWLDAAPSRSPSRGLLALAFDQRNHGTRLARAKANEAWRAGNETHAQDMLGTVVGGVVDLGVLMDMVGSYLFPGEEGRAVDRHLALGFSMGGHGVWQLMFAEKRVRAGVVVVGCPDFMKLISERAKKSKLSTAESGKSFLGSKDFPPALVETCRKYDPKGILFGTGEVPPPGDYPEHTKAILSDRLRGKRFLLCSGGEDRLVPYSCAEPFLNWFKNATGSWLKDEGISVEDIVYPGIGHAFEGKMITDALRFIVDNVDGDSGKPSPKI